MDYKIYQMAQALFYKDRMTGEHSHRVAYYAAKLGRAYGFSDDEIKNLRKVALLHDIGKITIPDSILKKPCALTPSEYEIMKTHTIAGANILKSVTDIPHVTEGALYHHERYDGKGYPMGISGDHIPLYGRLIALPDTFDAMTADRVYRNALDMSHVRSELRKGRGTQFDPVLCDIFILLIEKGEINPEWTFAKYRNIDFTEDIQ